MKRKRKALFLDRDGIINVERKYVHRQDQFEFQNGIFELSLEAQSQGYLLVVVTNQAGIGRGYYTEGDFRSLTEWMNGEFAMHGVEISRVYYCPFHPVSGIGKYKRESFDRKPNPGMILRAQKDLNLDLSISVFIGDQLTDMDAAKSAGVGTRVLLHSGTTNLELKQDIFVASSLEDIRLRLFNRE